MTENAASADLRHRYATKVTAGVPDTAIVAAFETVDRAHFVRAVAGPDGRPVPVTPDQVYSDDALVTHVSDGIPSSSSSQPSLMADMLAALRLTPGLRVLEIGAGTGYNAALIAAVTGAPVVSVDVQAAVVAEARAGLARAGVSGVTVLNGDGYRGAPGLDPFDRVVVTVGVDGVAPAWVDQLTPDGLVLAPIEHGGLQPCVVVARTPDGGLTGRGVLRSGFMLAAGPLHPGPRGTPALRFDTPPVGVPVRPVPPERYYELWFGLAVRDPRVNRRTADGLTDGLWPGPNVVCAVSDPALGTVAVAPDAVYPVDADPALVEHVIGSIEEWHDTGAPTIRDWRCGFTRGPTLWQPSGWTCS